VVHCAVGADAGEMARAMGHVLAAARASGAHVVQMSSVAVYGDVSGVVDEAAPCAKPAGAYGRTKLAAEGLCRVAATQGLPVTILRPSLIWGEGSAQWTLPYVARMHSGGWHALGAQGEGRANLIHVEDLAGFVAHILRAPRPRDLAVYNVNGADLPSWNGYLAALRDGLGLPPFLPERRWLGLAVLGRQMFRMADKIATRSLWRDGVPRFWWGWRRKAFNTPSRDEAQRFGAQVAYDITRMRQAGFAPQVDLASGIARLAAAKAPQRTECSTRPSTQEKSMKQAVEVAAALAIALFAARGDDVRAQAAAKAGQCIERANEDEMSSRIEDRGVSAWVSVRKPAQASVTASMEGVGSKLGLLRLSLMRDGQRLAPMQEETGSGRLEVRLRASIMLEPGHQYRIYAKPEGRDKAVKAVRLKISVDGGCG
jgi:nucleoside-diphosphate-sugar epimerase